MTTEKTAEASSHGYHSRCLLCGDLNPWSLGLSFEAGDDGTVSTTFRADPRLQGYDGIIHGGVIAALLDAAMTHCLFHHGIAGVTGDLHVRFVHSIPCSADLEIRGWVVSNHRSLHRLKAEIACDQRIMAWAEATFMERRVSDPSQGT